MIKEALWRVVAKIVSRPAIRDALIEIAKETPYFHLEGYMNRYWLFNPYDFDAKDKYKRKSEQISWLPSIRIHHILRKDDDRAMHDHPWDARTVILKGWYKERVLEDLSYIGPVLSEETYMRREGDTRAIKFGEYHSIDEVSEGGVWTMFFTWKYMGVWGFLVDGIKIPWREYLKETPSEQLNPA